MDTMYRVTRKFIGGILNGLTFTDTTSVKYEVGYICLSPFGGSAYEITHCEEI